jgi:hypothetical protein
MISWLIRRDEISKIHIIDGPEFDFPIYTMDTCITTPKSGHAPRYSSG